MRNINYNRHVFTFIELKSHFLKKALVNSINPDMELP